MGHSGPTRPKPRHDAATTVLVAGAGSPAGTATVRALTARGDRVIAVDADHRAIAGRDGETHEPFVHAIASEIDRHAVDAVIAATLHDVIALAGHETELGAPIWLPKRRAAAACIDRWRLWKIAERAGIPLVACALADDGVDAIIDSLAGPWIVKPRDARDAGTTYAADNREGLARACRRVVEPIVQTRATGRKFSVDLLADHGGRLVGAVPRWRPRSGRGVEAESRTFADARLDDIAARVVRAYNLSGPAHLNGVVTDTGAIALIDAGPTFSDGVALSIAAGADLVGEVVRGTLGGPVCRERLSFRPDVAMARPDAEQFAA